MRICFVENYSEAKPEPLIQALTDLGHEVSADCDEGTDIIFNASIEKMDAAMRLYEKYQKPLVNYCWDYYKWAHEGKHSYVDKNGNTRQFYDWKKYAEFISKGIVLVPSDGQRRRLKELLGIDSTVVKTSIETYNHPTKDERFVLDPVRYYTSDPNCYWAVVACRELGIPVVHSEHQFTKDEFRELVSNCTLMTCGYIEASTGGLTLMEGLWNGKPSLVSNSPYMGAQDYLGNFGLYFQHDDFDDLKRRLKELFFDPPKVDVKKARSYIKRNFSPVRMAKEIIKVCEQRLS